MVNYTLEYSAFPTCGGFPCKYCGQTWTDESKETREMCFDARHAHTFMVREMVDRYPHKREDGSTNYDRSVKVSQDRYGFVSYVGTTVKLGIHYNVRIMNDDWADVRYAISLDSTGAFVESSQGSSPYYFAPMVDAPEWLIAAYQTLVAFSGFIARFKSRLADEKRMAERAEEERNTPRKGKLVEVYKGRNVPKGTRGEVVWFGQGKRYSYYGDAPMRVGVKDALGTVHWTAASNVRVIHETAAAAE